MPIHNGLIIFLKSVRGVDLNLHNVAYMKLNKYEITFLVLYLFFFIGLVILFLHNR